VREQREERHSRAAKAIALYSMGAGISSRRRPQIRRRPRLPIRCFLDDHSIAPYNTLKTKLPMVIQKSLGYPHEGKCAMAESNPIYSYEFTVSATAVDRNGHVNNVMYVQWMQDVAVHHYDAIGGTAPMRAAGATWVVREHRIEYLRPAFAGEQIVVQTWVVDIRRVRSLRRYRFVRKSDGRLLARGETDWVFVDVRTGRPRKIPEEVASVFTLMPEA
jgi:acyl-CoA thioester hydrolase